MTSPRRIWLAVAVSSLGWGTSGVMTRVALDEQIRPYAIAAVRAGLAAVLIVVWAWARRRRPSFDGVTWRVGLVMGVSNLAIPLVAGNVALQYAGAGFVGVLAALIGLFTAALAHVMLPDEPMRLGKVGGLTIALVGVVVLFLSGDSGLGEGGRPLVAGTVAIFGYLSIAVGSVYAKKHAGRYAPIDVSLVQFVAGAIMVLVATIAVEGAPRVSTVLGGTALVYMALMSTVIPFLVYYWLLRHVTVVYAAIIGYLVPLVAVVVGIVALGEELQPGIVVGGALILAGVVVTDRVEQRIVPQGQAAESPAVTPLNGD
ncbi:MAG TPA: DMT family transporter [Acidimicrobiia bacterium]|nr:DMT family transporter [Acidimicrobiia bacterium]